MHITAAGEKSLVIFNDSCNEPKKELCFPASSYLMTWYQISGNDKNDSEISSGAPSCKDQS